MMKSPSQVKEPFLDINNSAIEDEYQEMGMLSNDSAEKKQDLELSFTYSHLK